MFTRCRKGSIIVDFELRYIGNFSRELKDSLITALGKASGLKGLGAKFEDFTICGRPTFLLRSCKSLF